MMAAGRFLDKRPFPWYTYEALIQKKKVMFRPVDSIKDLQT
jgi:hypothetical protein